MRASEIILIALACLAPVNSESETFDTQFIGFKSFSNFKRSQGGQSNEVVLTSREIHSRIQWNELIVSWNIEMPTNTYLKVEARAIYPDLTRTADGPRPQHCRQPCNAGALKRSFSNPRAASRDGSRSTTKFYTMGLWSSAPPQHPRESVSNQKDADGDVLTDTLALKQSAERFQVRVTLGKNGRQKPKLKFLGISLLNTNAVQTTHLPNRFAWGKTIDVPERSQMPYANGVTLCSPATVSMLLAYWSRKLNRPELDRAVPEISKGVFDPNWPGTGNWSFNMAYAGSFRGLRAYVTRLGDVSELEDWIAAGIPVGLSVCYNRLRGKSREPSGHIVVLCGFTEAGDAIINDPGTSQNVRKIFPRANLIDAWSYSRNTVYLIYPSNAKLPKDNIKH